MTTWLYRFASNDRFPEPIQEIAALAAIDDESSGAWLALSARASPPGKSAMPGDSVLLCTSLAGRLVLHGHAVVASSAVVHESTPESVRGVYGTLVDRLFVRLERFHLVLPQPVEDLSAEEEEIFLRGQSYVKKLSKTKPLRAAPSESEVAVRAEDTGLPSMLLERGAPAFSVVGVDPTAGDWRHAMHRGDAKAMPIVSLAWSAGRFRFVSLATAYENRAVWETARAVEARVVCIDGPCSTNGLKVLPDWSGWDPSAVGGVRDGERALHDAGVKLYWTTKSTVTNFDGASRWIARSLRLFGDPEGAGFNRIETHPHGAFLMMQRSFDATVTLASKTTPSGRGTRLALLRSLVDNLDASCLPDHDAVDAACAALLGGLHVLGLTTSYGTLSGGGLIWMPAPESIRSAGSRSSTT